MCNAVCLSNDWPGLNVRPSVHPTAAAKFTWRHATVLWLSVHTVHDIFTLAESVRKERRRERRKGRRAHSTIIICDNTFTGCVALHYY